MKRYRSSCAVATVSHRASAEMDVLSEDSGARDDESYYRWDAAGGWREGDSVWPSVPVTSRRHLDVWQGQLHILSFGFEGCPRLCRSKNALPRTFRPPLERSDLLYNIFHLAVCDPSPQWQGLAVVRPECLRECTRSACSVLCAFVQRRGLRASPVCPLRAEKSAAWMGDGRRETDCPHAFAMAY